MFLLTKLRVFGTTGVHGRNGGDADAGDAEPPRDLARSLGFHARRYAIGLAAFAAALGARFALGGVLPPAGFPFLTFFPAVILATLFGGFGPGFMAAVLSTAAADYFFIPPLRSFQGASNADLIALGVLFAVVLVDCVIIHAMNTLLGRVRAERARGVRLARKQGARRSWNG